MKFAFSAICCLIFLIDLLSGKTINQKATQVVLNQAKGTEKQQDIHIGDKSMAEILSKKKDNNDVNDIVDAVQKLINQLSKRKDHDKEIQSSDEKEVKRHQENQETQQSEIKFDTIKYGSKKSEANDFRKFMDIFNDIFLTSKQDATKTYKQQLIYGSGKDNHHRDEDTSEKRSKQVLIGSGMDSKKINEVDNRHAHLNRLYDKLRTETAVHVDKQRVAAEEEKDVREQKNGRLELVKKDMVDLLNSLQSRETFTYHDGKFALQQEKDGAGSRSAATVKNKEEEESSKLAFVESLLKQLKSLEDAKKREQSDVETKKEIVNEKEQQKSEVSTDHDDAAERMKVIFKEDYKNEMEKRKSTEKKDNDNNDNKNNDVSMKKGSLRDTLDQLMNQLYKHIANEKNKSGR